MKPTPRAEELATPIRMALDGLQQSLEPVQNVFEIALESVLKAGERIAAGFHRGCIAIIG